MLESKRTKQRLKLNIDQRLTHYIIVFFLLLYTGLSIWDLTISYKESSEIFNSIVSSILLLFLTILFAIIQYQRLYFYEININYSEEQFQKTIKAIEDSHEWLIENNSKKLCKFYIPTNFFGYSLTVLKYKNRILINSIGSLNGRMPPFLSFTRNNKNINIFILRLDEVIQGKELEEKKEVLIEKEWSTKMLLIRLFAYPLSFLLIIFGLYVILHTTTKAIPVGIGALIFPIIYLYSDLKILINKKCPNR